MVLTCLPRQTTKTARSEDRLPPRPTLFLLCKVWSNPEVSEEPNPAAVKRDRVKSLEELQATIRDDRTINELVRKQALDWAELFWKNRQARQDLEK